MVREEIVDKPKTGSSTRSVSFKNEDWEKIDKYCSEKFMKLSSLFQMLVSKHFEELELIEGNAKKNEQ
jgi:hypothetical protein